MISLSQTKLTLHTIFFGQITNAILTMNWIWSRISIIMKLNYMHKVITSKVLDEMNGVWERNTPPPLFHSHSQTTLSCDLTPVYQINLNCTTYQRYNCKWHWCAIPYMERELSISSSTYIFSNLLRNLIIYIFNIKIKKFRYINNLPYQLYET